MDLFVSLFVILLAAKLGAEVCLRIGQPAVVGEILAGVAIGVLVHLGGEALGPIAGLTHDDLFEGLTELGAFCLLLAAGIELDGRDMLEASRRSMAIAIAGMLVPFGAGLALGYMVLPASDYRTTQALFLGTALAITAVPVAIKVLMDLGQLDSPLGRSIVAAAVADDILSLFLLALLTGLMHGGEAPGAGDIVLIVVKAGMFAAFVGLLFRYNSPRVQRAVAALEVEQSGFVALLLTGLLLAVLAELLGLHFIIGAFAAGLLFSRREVPKQHYEAVKGKVDALAAGFLGPLFFVSIGLYLDPSALVAIPGFVALLITVAFLGKIVGAGGAALATGFAPRSAWNIGVSMSARGVVELIVASVAARAGLFDRPVPTPAVIEHLFSAVVIMAIVTSIAVPVVLRATLSREHDD